MTSRQQGVAIVSVLLLMAALVALGLATMFLTQMNLGIAGNARSATRADNNAVAGLNAAFVALQRAFVADGEFPDALALPDVAGVGFAPTYVLDAYERRSPTLAYVAVRGTAPRDAEYVAEALVAMESGSTRLPTYFDYGIATEGKFTGNGSGSYVSTGIHANEGFSLNGSQEFSVCTQRNSAGICTRTETVSGDAVPISGSPGADCSVNPAQPGICKNGVPVHLTDPVTIQPDYVARRDAALAAISHGSAHSSLFGIDCDVRYTSRPNPVSGLLDAIAALPPGSTVCLEYNQATGFNGSVSLDGVNIVSRGDLTINGGLTSRDSTFIAYDGKFSTNGKDHLTNVNVYSQKGLTLNGSSSAVYDGTTTLATAGDITVNGSYKATPQDDGTVGIGVALIAEGDITVNGSSDMFLAAVAGGKFTQNGSSTIRGRIAAKKDIKVNGSFDIDAGLGIINPELSEPGDFALVLVSRR